MRFLLHALLLATAAPPPTPPAQPESETLAIAEDGASRMTLQTRINGHGPYPFTIDTAAEHSIVSDQLVEMLGLAAGEPATLFSVVGAQPVSTVTIDALRIGRRDHRVEQAPVLPQRTLGAPGLIGLDALANVNLLFDFRDHSVRVTPSLSDTVGNDFRTISVDAKRRFGQLIIADASVNGVKVLAIVDTGANDSLGNLALRKMLGRPGPLEDRGVRLIGVTGGALPVELGAIPAIRLGAITMMGMPIAYGDIATFHRFGLDHTPAILIGMDVLRNFERVAVDFRRREIRFHLAGDQLFRRS